MNCYSPNVFEFCVNIYDKSIEMSSTSSSGVLISREDAVYNFQAILKEKESVHVLVVFETFNKTARLRSKYYCPYFVLCFMNTTRLSGWFFCRYLMNLGCQPDKSVLSFTTIQGDTFKLDRHTRLRTQTRASTSHFARAISLAANKTIAKSAAYNVALELRPMLFCGGHFGMIKFTKEGILWIKSNRSGIWKYWIHVFFSRSNCSDHSSQRIGYSVREIFLKEMKNACLKHSGALSVDGLHSKADGKQNYDFTVHFMRVKRENAHDDTTFQITNKRFILFEEPEVPTASNIR